MALLEICANSIQSALNAEKGGADRIELCQNLEAGGTTPSAGLIAQVKHKLKIPVYVLIRPRTGDFVYDEDDFHVMLDDIRTCRELGCDGVVVGVLTRDAYVDVQRLTTLVHAAKPLPVTFHRAFDDCLDQLQAIEDVIQAGCARILTSGGCDDAMAGSSTIAKLVEIAAGRIVVMPGAGINAQNVPYLAQATGASEYHASGKTVIEPSLESMFKAKQLQTEENLVRALADSLTRSMLPAS